MHQELLLQFARTFAEQGALDEALSIISPAPENYKLRFAEFHLSQESNCASAQNDLVTLARKFRISHTPITIGAAVACARVGDDKAAEHLLLTMLSDLRVRETLPETEKIVLLSYGLKKSSIIKLSLVKYLNDCNVSFFIRTSCVRMAYSLAWNTLGPEMQIDR